MQIKKTSKKYYFSVEGETKDRYLTWLKNEINANEMAAYKVCFDKKIEKDPIKRAKGMIVTGKTTIYHFFDYESIDEFHQAQFKETLDKMKDVSKLGKQIIYKSGYSNFTFDLWMVLHKTDLYTALSHRSQYLKYINDAFGEKFLDMDEYKHKANFERCLEKLSLADVIDAVNRSEFIMAENERRGYVLHKYKGYSYYDENPSMNVGTIVKTILCDCKLM